jgi:hypothetical protein
MQPFYPGDKIIYSPNPNIQISGVIKYLRDDSYERKMRETNKWHYYYSVDFDDGKKDTYVPGSCMRKIV